MRIFFGALAAMAGCLFCTGIPAAAQTVRPMLALQDAIRMAASAASKASAMQRAVSIVVVNREGRVILAQRMDGASFVSLKVAEGKAITAAAVGVPTRMLEQQVDGGKPASLSVPDVVMVTGGLPIASASAVIGGIGVSGGAPDEDETIAQAGLSGGSKAD